MATLNKNDAERTAKSIANDIKSRKGLGDEWEKLDEDIQKAIIESWKDTIWTEMTRGVI